MLFPSLIRVRATTRASSMILFFATLATITRLSRIATPLDRSVARVLVTRATEDLRARTPKTGALRINLSIFLLPLSVR
ncbi:MAG: hypothetical protein A4E62_03185 [Syntrophorhabdus sp. PtaU1.Bin002]|nr:MAG: hypothetical protein A4E62_03185 [Syntrophorhabdus sp. PtaU1.Bin002]